MAQQRQALQLEATQVYRFAKKYNTLCLAVRGKVVLRVFGPRSQYVFLPMNNGTAGTAMISFQQADERNKERTKFQESTVPRLLGRIPVGGPHDRNIEWLINLLFD